MRATRRWRPRYGPPIPRCCTTAPVGSSWPAPPRSAVRDPLRDVLLGMVAATEEPIAGGRHKVFGRHDLNIIPQTSTIASHLPRAVGVAFSIARSQKAGRGLSMARRRDHGVQLRRRVGEPLHRGRRHQRRAALGVSRCADAVVVRLRGQRDRHQRQNTADGGSSTPTETVTGCGISTPTAATWRRRSTPRPPPPPGCVHTVALRSCICGWCG